MKTLIRAAVLAAFAAVSLLAAPAQAEASDVWSVKCYENYRWVKDLQVMRPHGSRCGVARKVMRRWYDVCPLEGDCRIRIGYYGTLWRCYTSREYMRVRPYYASCNSGRDQHQFTWFTYTG